MKIALNPFPCQSLDAYQTKLFLQTVDLASTWTPDDELGSVRGQPWASPLLERSGQAHTEKGGPLASAAWRFFHAGLGPADLATAFVDGGYVSSTWVERLGLPMIDLASADYAEQLRYAHGYISSFWTGLLARAKRAGVEPRYKNNEIHDKALRRISTTFRGSSSERAVLYALWGIAHANNGQDVTVSVRQLSEYTGFSYDYVSRVLVNLCKSGIWVEKLPVPGPQRTARYRLLEQEDVTDEEFEFYSDSISADPGYLLSRYRAFHYGGSLGGLGGTAARVVAVLSRNPTTVEEIVRRTRLVDKTVVSALSRLLEAGVVSKTHDNRWLLIKDYRDRLLEVADERGLADRIDVLKKKHEIHRRLYSGIKQMYRLVEKRAARKRAYRKKQQQWCRNKKSKKAREPMVDYLTVMKPERETFPAPEENIFASEESFAEYQYNIQFNNERVDKAMGELIQSLEL